MPVDRSRSLPVLHEGQQVQVEGNGVGHIRFSFSTHVGGSLMYNVQTEDGRRVEVTYDKVEPLGDADLARNYRRAVADFKGRKPGPVPDLMGAAALHTGVVRAPSNPQTGDTVCLCKHPNQNVPGRHDEARVVDVRPGNLEPYVLQDKVTGAFTYANHKQITKIDPFAYCPYDNRVKQSEIATAFSDRERGQLPGEDRKGKQYFWGFAIGDDVAVRGWGAGKIQDVEPDAKKPIVVRTARGQLVHAALQDLTKIEYGSVTPDPSARLKAIEDRLKGIEEILNKIWERQNGKR